MPINEFVLWDNCNNNCQFCFQKLHGRPFTIDIQLKSIQNLKLILKEDKICNCHMLIVGGELFNVSNELKLEFLDLVDIIISKMKEDKIIYLYVNTSLTYDDTDCLDKFIQKFITEKLINRLKFTTSYDLFGRFTDKTKHIFETTLKKLVQINDLNIVANTILTKQFCKYVEHEFAGRSYVKSFEEKFKCKLNLIPYVNVNSIMLPKIEDVLKVLVNERMHYDKWFLMFKDNYNLKQQKNVYKFDGCSFINDTACNAKCGHSVNFSKYSESNSCFICDVNKIFES